MQVQRLSDLRVDELKRLCTQRSLSTKLFQESPNRQGLCLLLMLSQYVRPRHYNNLTRAEVARLIFGDETEFNVTLKDTKLYLLRSIHTSVDEHLVDATKALAKELSLCILAIETDLIANTLHNRISLNNLSCLHAGLIALLVTYINNRLSLERSLDYYDLTNKLGRKYLSCSNIHAVVSFFLYYPSNYRMCYGLESAIEKLRNPIVLAPPTSRKRGVGAFSMTTTPVIETKKTKRTEGHVEQFFRNNIRGTLLTRECHGTWHRDARVVNALIAKFGNTAHCILPEMRISLTTTGHVVAEMTTTNTSEIQAIVGKEVYNDVMESIQAGVIESFSDALDTFGVYKMAIEKQQCQSHAWMVFSLIMYLSDTDGHANVVIIDTEKFRIIRFDPNTITSAAYDRMGRLVDAYLEKKFAPHVLGDKRYRVVTPIGFCPNPGPQAYEALSTYFNIKCEGGGEGGFCLSWSMLLINLMIAYPHDDPSALLQELLNAHRWDLDSIHKGLEQKRSEQPSHPLVQLDTLLQIIAMKYTRFIELLVQGRTFRAGPRAGAVLPRFQRR